METHFMNLPTNSFVLILLPEGVWNSVVSVARTDDFYTVRASAIGAPVL
jgi:hypothetical protein